MATISNVSSGQVLLSPSELSTVFLGCVGFSALPTRHPTEKCTDCCVHGKDNLQIIPTFLPGVCQHAWAPPALAAMPTPVYIAAMRALPRLRRQFSPGQSLPPGDTWQCQAALNGLNHAGATGIQWGEARDAAQHSHCTGRSALQHKMPAAPVLEIPGTRGG